MAEIKELLGKPDYYLFVITYSGGGSIQDAAAALKIDATEAERRLDQALVAVAAWEGERRQRERERQLGINDAA